jgi:hypothetical protein
LIISGSVNRNAAISAFDVSKDNAGVGIGEDVDLKAATT